MKGKIINWGAFIFTVLSFYYCEKDATDYRYPYTGEFKFTVVSNTKSMCHDSTEICVNGWKRYNFDTTHILSHIELFLENRLKIHFGDGVFGHNYDLTFYPNFLSRTFT